MEDNKNEMSITEAIERCDIMLNAISINGAEKGFANDDNGFPDCVVMKSLIRRCKGALKKQIPKKPVHDGCLDSEGMWHEWNGVNGRPYDLCPNCNTNICCEMPCDSKPNYCSKCGCRLDWSDDE